MDGGYYCHYVKTFATAGLTAIVEFSGAHAAEAETGAAFVKGLGFCKASPRGLSEPVALAKVPAVLVSEAWNDYREMAAKGAFDPEWKTKLPW